MRTHDRAKGGETGQELKGANDTKHGPERDSCKKQILDTVLVNCPSAAAVDRTAQAHGLPKKICLPKRCVDNTHTRRNDDLVAAIADVRCVRVHARQTLVPANPVPVIVF